MIVDEDAPSKMNPINSGPHRYHVLVYEQSNIIDKFKINIDSRPKFDLDKFVSINILKLFNKFMFQTERI